MVEDVDTQYTMDCTDTTTSIVSPSVVFPFVPTTVPSQRVREKGAAHNVKRGVPSPLVSANGPSSPLASDDSESPADESEVFPVEL